MADMEEASPPAAAPAVPCCWLELASSALTSAIERRMQGCFGQYKRRLVNRSVRSIMEEALPPAAPAAPWELLVASSSFTSAAEWKARGNDGFTRSSVDSSQPTLRLVNGLSHIACNWHDTGLWKRTHKPAEARRLGGRRRAGGSGTTRRLLDTGRLNHVHRLGGASRRRSGAAAGGRRGRRGSSGGGGWRPGLARRELVALGSVVRLDRGGADVDGRLGGAGGERAGRGAGGERAARGAERRHAACRGHNAVQLSK